MLQEFREQHLTWDKANRRIYENVKANASDSKGRKLTVQVLNDGVVADLTGTSLSLYWETRSKQNKGLDAFDVVDASQGIFELYYTTGMLSNEGKLRANLVLVDDLGRIVSDAFVIDVSPGIDDDAVESSDSFTALTKALVDIQNLEQNYAPQLQEVADQLDRKVAKGEIELSDFDKNKIQFDETWMTDEFKQQMAGGTPIHSVPADESLTTRKYVDGSVTPQKISYLNATGVNVFDAAKATSGYFLDNGNGNLISSSNYQVSDYIEALANDYFVSNSGLNVVFYNSEKAYVTGVDGTAWSDHGSVFKILKVPDNPNIRFARFSLHNVPERMVLKGRVAPSHYVPFGEYEVGIKDETMNKAVKKRIEDTINSPTFLYRENSIPLEAARPFAVKVTNLVNEANLVPFSYVNASTGELSSHAGDSATEFIPIKPNTPYSFSLNRNVGWYDEKKVFIKSTGGGFTGPLISPPNAYYLRTSFTSSSTKRQIAEGTTLPPYLPYQHENNVRIDYRSVYWKRNFVNLIERSSRLSGLKWNALGDSITEGARTTKSYVDYIVEATGITARNYGVSGTTISSLPNAQGEGMSVRYASMANDADIVTVFGGTNDWGHGEVVIGEWNDGTSTTLYGGTQTLIEGLFNKYPTAKVGFILPIPRHTINGDNTLGDYVSVIKEVCDRYSIPVLDLYHGSGIMPGLAAHKTALIPDGTHPNEEGHRIIATKIQRFLESL